MEQDGVGYPVLFISHELQANNALRLLERLGDFSTALQRDDTLLTLGTCSVITLDVPFE